VELNCNVVRPTIALSLTEMVDKVMARAKGDGSVVHPKSLADGTGLSATSAAVAPEICGARKRKAEPAKSEPAESEPEGPGLSEVLLRTLREMLEEAKATKAKEQRTEEANRAAAGISVP
jgi:hypothetical protein